MSDEKKIEQVTFHYVKSNSFRVVHCDGIIGGLTPQGYLNFAMYSERVAIPQTRTHELTPEGKLREPAVKEITRGGVVRELEVDAVMNIQQMIAFRDWLTERIDEHSKLVHMSTDDLGREAFKNHA